MYATLQKENLSNTQQKRGLKMSNFRLQRYHQNQVTRFVKKNDHCNFCGRRHLERQPDARNYLSVNHCASVLHPPQKRCRRHRDNHHHLYSRWQRCRPSDLREVVPYAWRWMKSLPLHPQALLPRGMQLGYREGSIENDSHHPHHRLMRRLRPLVFLLSRGVGRE